MRDRRGAATVEFAVVVPIFILLMLGMIELGRALQVQQRLTNASREGARVLTRPDATLDEVTNTVNRSFWGASDLLPEQRNVLNLTLSDDGDVVQVQVELFFDQKVTVKGQEVFCVSYIPPWFLKGDRARMEAQTTMMKEIVR